MYLLISLLLVIMCGIFVAAEFSFIAVSRSTVETKSAAGDKDAVGIMQALRKLSRQLSGAQVGITVTNLVIGFLAEPALTSLLTPVLSGLSLPDSFVRPVAFVCGVSIATIVTMLLGELVPKNFALARPYETAKVVQLPQRLFTYLAWPVIALLNHSANALLRRMNIEPREELASARSADELLSVVQRSAKQGKMSAETAYMLEHTLTFGDLAASDVMTPRVRVQTIEQHDTIAEFLHRAATTGISRFPVILGSIDTVVGIAHIKHAVHVPLEKRQKTTMKDIMQPALFVPSTIELESLLPQLRKDGRQMAIVTDEYGGMDGIVTIEDLVEELVGEVDDEHDELTEAIVSVGKNSWRVPGLLRPDEVKDVTRILLPDEEDYDTIGGLVADRLNKIPRAGDRLMIDAIDVEGSRRRVRLQVKSMDGLRVETVIMKDLGRVNAETES